MPQLKMPSACEAVGALRQIHSAVPSTVSTFAGYGHTVEGVRTWVAHEGVVAPVFGVPPFTIINRPVSACEACGATAVASTRTTVVPLALDTVPN